MNQPDNRVIFGFAAATTSSMKVARHQFLRILSCVMIARTIAEVRVCPFKKPITYSKRSLRWYTESPEKPVYISNSKEFNQITLDMIKPNGSLAKNCQTLQYRFNGMDQIVISESTELDFTSGAEFIVMNDGQQKWRVDIPEKQYPLRFVKKHSAYYKTSHIDVVYRGCLVFDLEHIFSMQIPPAIQKLLPGVQPPDEFSPSLTDSDYHTISFPQLTHVIAQKSSE
uniref:AlNc14C167G7902 protein n=1 Tax=Albugo laibachii Nc14 TaxID=890382 RepID=F0WN69_9STRA|nr:AlNc14C167G7902 [Albugo laibachii Nc14]|eukprot:CCA22758.1 AlNc14C167G7902 [Albugo laibachii Nc14]